MILRGILTTPPNSKDTHFGKGDEPHSEALSVHAGLNQIRLNLDGPSGLVLISTWSKINEKGKSPIIEPTKSPSKVYVSATLSASTHP